MLTFIELILFLFKILLFLCKEFYNTRLKIFLMISSLIQLSITYHVLSVSFNRVRVIMNLKDSPTNKVFTIEGLHSTNKISEFSTDTHFKLLTVSKMKSKNNRLYLKMAFILSGDVN